jgi:DNA-binding transcriptional ArsR family regulator
MLKYADPIDAAFHALADPGRRAIVDRLSRGPASVSELAALLTITLAGVMQHLRVLEAGGLVSTTKRGRVRSCSLEPAALDAAEGWIRERRAEWSRRLDRLGEYLNEEPNTPTRSTR